MPITFAPATCTGAQDTHPATSRDVTPVTAVNLLSAASFSANVAAKPRIVRSSVGGRPGPDNTHFKIAPAPGSGFVDTVLCAYTHHHALVIRPDDVWLAIVSQFSFYTTAKGNSCSFLDNASGKMALEIPVESDTAQPDVTRLSRRITRLLQKMVPDADLRDWLVPEFSTTTLTDTMVSCMLVLSGLYSSSAPTATQTRSRGDADYTFGALCGIPRVTLEGERADWELLLSRLDRLKTQCKDFGTPTVAWYHLLHPVLARFVGAFDDPESAENREFWGGVVVWKEESNGNGDVNKNAGKLSGWITAFCAFSVEGTWLGPELNASAAADAPETLTAGQFWSTYTLPALAPEKPKPKPKSKGAKAKGKKAVQLDLLDVDSAAPPAPTIVISLADVPRAYSSAELELSLKTKTTKVSGDASAGVNGTATTREHACTVLAGLVGTGFSSSRDTALSATGRNDTVRPVVAWWIYQQGGAGARAIGNQKAEAREDARNTKAEEHIPVVPAPRVQFDLDLDRALAGTAGAGVGVGVEDATSPGAGTGATDMHEPEPEPVSASALTPVEQSDPWSLNLHTPVTHEPPAQPAAPTSSLDDLYPDAVGSGGGGGADADAEANAGGWNSVSWSTPAPASKFTSGLGFGSGSGFEFGTAPAAVPDPKPEPEGVTSGGQDAAEIALQPDVTPTAETGDGGEAAVKPGEEQTLEQEQEQEQQLETQTETPAPAPPAPEDPEPQPEPEPDAAAAVVTPAAPAGDGEDGDGDEAADDAATQAAAAAAAKAGEKNNAGGGKGGKGKKKKGKK